jgi:hypothetical protein
MKRNYWCSDEFVQLNVVVYLQKSSRTPGTDYMSAWVIAFDA